MPSDPSDLTEDRLAATLPVDREGRPSIGGVSLLRKLGVGGMGAVYLGRQERLGRDVAVKILPFNLIEQDPRMVDRFQAEAKMAGGIDSPHVVRVLDVGCEYGTNFYVMEYVAGASAGALLKKRREEGERGLPELEALRIVRGATKGLAAAHAAGVVHRDIKPDNILIPKGDPDAAKLADLGLAKPEGTGQTFGTRTGVAMGTPGFMAPEQAEDAKGAGPAADVFAMGATLHALLSGEAPFRGSSLVAVLRSTLNGDATPLPKGTSSGVQWLVARCLTPRPEERFQNGAELLKAIERVLRDPADSVIPSVPPLPASVVRAEVPSKTVMSDPARPVAKKSGVPRLVLTLAALLLLGVTVVVAWKATRQDKGKKPAPEGGQLPKQVTEAEILARAEALEARGNYEAALDELKALPADSAAVVAARERIERTMRGKTEREYDRLMREAEEATANAEKRDTEGAWDAVISDLSRARKAAETGPEASAAEAELTKARARRLWALGKERERGGKFDEALEFGKQALAESDAPGLREWNDRIRQKISSDAETSRRRERMQRLEAEAAKETGAAALKLVEEALEQADAPEDRRRLELARDTLKSALKDLAQREEYLARVKDAAERMGKGDLEGAKRSLDQAAAVWADGPGLADTRSKLEIAMRNRAWQAAMAEAEALEKKNDLPGAVAAWKRAIEARPDDEAAHARVEDLEIRIAALRPAVKGNRLELALDASTRLDFVAVPAGSFVHGDGKDERRVRISRPFYMQTTELTQAQWLFFMKENPSAFAGPNRPVEQVSWYMAQRFIALLNRRLDGWTASLPTEMQFEYANRAGSKSFWLHGSSEPGIENYAWYLSNSANFTHDVGRLKPNAFGLFDTSGNVAELCFDGFYPLPERKDLVDPAPEFLEGTVCVRGSAWNGDANWLRCSRRGEMFPEQQFSHIGFRLILTEGEGTTVHVPRRTFFLDAAKKVRVDFVLVRAGKFGLGQKDGAADEPPHRVTLTREYWIQETETTQAQWEALMGPREFARAHPDLPADNLTWDEAQKFAQALGKKVGMKGSLPTEAEWEVACRAGSTTKWWHGYPVEFAGEIAWTSANAKTSQRVARLRANPLGLYDTAGNLAEWCSDWLAPLSTEETTDPQGPAEGTMRVLRGGSFMDDPQAAGSSARTGMFPGEKDARVGVRVLLR